MNNEIVFPTAQLAGRYKLEVRRHGVLIHETDWFDNLITDAGLEAMVGNEAPGRFCMVGTGSTAPANTNTVLEAQIAVKDGFTGGSTGVVTSSPRYGWQRLNYAFAQGAVVGNVAEVGVGWTSTAVFSRSLVSPVIPLLAIDQLTVVYELRMYLPTTNTTGTVTLGGTSYDYTIRPMHAASATSAFAGYGWAPVAMSYSVTSGKTWTSSGLDQAATAYTGTAAVQTNVEAVLFTANADGTGATAGQAGTSGPTTFSSAAYTPASKEVRFTFEWGISNGNAGGGISAIKYHALFGTYGCVFSAPIPKDNTKVLSLTFKQSWARRP